MHDTKATSQTTGETMAQTLIDGFLQKGVNSAAGSTTVEVARLAIENGYNLSMDGSKLELYKPVSEEIGLINETAHKADELMRKLTNLDRLIHGLYNKLNISDGAIRKMHTHGIWPFKRRE